LFLRSKFEEDEKKNENKKNKEESGIL